MIRFLLLIAILVLTAVIGYELYRSITKTTAENGNQETQAGTES